MERVSRKHLEHLVAEINRLTGSPATGWTKGEDGRLVANPGHYCLASHRPGAVRLYALERMETSGGGVSRIGVQHSMPAREAVCMLQGMVAGLRAGRGG